MNAMLTREATMGPRLRRRLRQQNEAIQQRALLASQRALRDRQQGAERRRKVIARLVLAVAMMLPLGMVIGVALKGCG